MSDHKCFTGDNPRNQNACLRCGKVMPPPPPPVTDLCDLQYETDLLLEAGRQAGVDARALDAFSKARKHPGPVIDHLTRDLVQDLQEELGDAVHYAVWDIEALEHKGELTVDLQWNYMQALGHVAAAFYHAQVIRGLKR